MATAAALIVGDEILSGKFPDRNGAYLARRLRELGCELRHMAFIPDDVRRIGEEVARLAGGHDWLFTSGGVGPTHDDMTFAGIARGLGVPLLRHPVLEEVIRQRWNSPVNEDALRMAEVPAETEFWWDGEIAFPVCVVRNIIVLPGMPRLFEAKLDAISQRLRAQPLHTQRLFVTERETRFAGRLREVAARHPGVAVGSYPRWESERYRVMLTLESRDRQALRACRAELKRALGSWLVAGG